MHLFILSLVVVTPTGPLYIAINTSRTIYCSVPERIYSIFWIIRFQITHGKNYYDVAKHYYDVPGFMIMRNETSASLTINTTDTSIFGCWIVLKLNANNLYKNVDLTIYGMLIL